MADKDADILYIKQRKVKHWAVIFVLLLVITVCLKMRVTNVQVHGNDTYTEEEAENLIFSDYWDRNTVVVLYRSLTGKKKVLPFVEDYKVVLKSPISCELRFYEKKPIGCIKYMSSFMYFDKDGIMIESSQKRLPGVPVIEGLEFGYVVLEKALPIDSMLIMNNITGITQQLSLYDIGCSGIIFNESGSSVTVVLEDGDIEVKLGTDKDLAAKVAVLNDMLPKIRERNLNGVLDLSTYVDGARNSVSTFKLKKNETDASDVKTEPETDMTPETDPASEAEPLG